MEIPKLISIQDIQEYTRITSSVDSVKSLEPFIIDAQEMDLRPFIGQELYIDLINEFESYPSLPTYNYLFNGCTYQVGTKNYLHHGLKAVLVFYTWHRFILGGNIQSTRMGMVVKKNEFSEPASEATIARIASQAKSMAVVYQDSVKCYLDNNNSLYPLWKCNRGHRGSIKIRGIG